MVSRHRRGGVLQDIGTLFDSGTTVGLTDGELLTRFADRAGRDRSGDVGDPAGPAFAALVERHGPMVLRVCRSVLHDEHDAQDAFQATFLVLVRRARAVRRQESVGSWLHGVALRVSARARADVARRRRHERRAGEASLMADRSDPGGIAPESAAILHEELDRLPERYRAAVVLCYLEDHTCEAAARRLGWPVGTVKSRLARGRERLRGRLIRRGLTPDEMDRSPLSPIVALPTALVHSTVEAMARFAAGWPAAGAVSETVLRWTLRTLRTMHMTRLALISALLAAGFAATGAAMFVTRDGDPAQDRLAARPPEPARPATSQEKVQRFNVRVTDTSGRGVPSVEVALIEEDAVPRVDGPAHRIAAYRTGADGRAQFVVGPRFHRLLFEARPDDRTVGWASLNAGDAWLKANGASPISMILLPLDHRVEGTIVDTRGRPIVGVRVRAEQLHHEANGFAMGYPRADEKALLGSAVTDEAGRYHFSFPAETSVILGVCHPRYAGPWFSCGSEARTVAPVTMEDAGAISGRVIDAATGRPVAGARVGAGRIEITERTSSGDGRAVSDAQGHFAVGGLPPGVYNLVLRSSPMGRRFTARAVEGVRVQAGREANADLRLIEGRRLAGKAIYAVDGEPVAGVGILAESKPHQRSGAAHQSTVTDDQGCFELFVPPGPVLVFITNGAGPGSAAQTVLNVPNDRDPDPVLLKRGDDPNASPASHPQPRRPIACEVRVRVRVKTDSGDRSAPGDGRTLTGRIFDKSGTPLPAIRLDCLRGQTHIGAATDRLGLFRLQGPPRGRFELYLIRHEEQWSQATIPADAVEVDLIVP